MTASATLEACMRAHAEKIGLEIVSLAGGVWAKPREASDRRVTNAARIARAACSRADMPCAEVRKQATVFQVNCPAGLHAARVAARAISLATVKLSRRDSEGIDNVDIEAQSDPAWKSWCKRLVPEKQAFLDLWRAGAIHTPTRRWSWRDDEKTLCPHCGASRASARHFWAECPRFTACREALQQDFGIQPAWWQQQPRVTSKSGWITVGAGTSTEQRASRQIAACSLGIHIVAVGLEET